MTASRTQSSTGTCSARRGDSKDTPKEYVLDRAGDIFSFITDALEPGITYTRSK